MRCVVYFGTPSFKTSLCKFSLNCLVYFGMPRSTWLHHAENLSAWNLSQQLLADVNLPKCQTPRKEVPQ